MPAPKTQNQNPFIMAIRLQNVLHPDLLPAFSNQVEEFDIFTISDVISELPSRPEFSWEIDQ